MKRTAGILLALLLMLPTGGSAWAADSRTSAATGPSYAIPLATDARVAPASTGAPSGSSPLAVSTASIVVGYGPGDGTEAAISAMFMGARIVRRSKSDGFVVVSVPAGWTPQSLAARLDGDSGVLYAEPDQIVRATMASTDPGFSSQWGMSRIAAPQAWDVTRGAGVKVAVIDTGVDLDHPDLVARLDTTADYDFVNGDTTADDDSGHGTHVAGIIGATLNNGIGVAGVANLCTILPVKVLDSTGAGFSSNVADGIRWAADNGAKVINLSLGMPGYSIAVDQAVQYAVSKDCVVVAAAGNDGTYGVIYPAACENVIGVGSTDSADSRSGFSNYGPGLDVVAPGSTIYSTTSGGSYGSKSGTSMATPHAAGVVALIRARFPSYSRGAAELQLMSTCVDLGTAGRDDFYGYGRIQANIAVLTPPGTLSGQVTSGGASLSGATVSVHGYPSVTTRDASGGYTVSGLAPGTHSVTYSKTGYVSQTLAVSISPGSVTNRNVMLAEIPPGTLSGRVTSNNGVLPGVTVSVPGYEDWITDYKGDYSRTRIAPGTYGVTYAKSGYATKTVSVTISGGRTTVKNVDLGSWIGAGTLVPGPEISSSVTWTRAGSPYIITNPVSIAAGATLTIEPGVVVKSENPAWGLGVGGALTAVGTAQEMVYFDGVPVGGSGRIELRYCVLEGGSLGLGTNSNGALILTDSRVEYPTGFCDMYYPQSDCYIERNMFRGSMGFRVATRASLATGRPVNVYFRNNVFFDQRSDGSSEAFISNWHSEAGSITYVNGNTFYPPTDADSPEFLLQLEGSGGVTDGTGNYWAGIPDPGAYIDDRGRSLSRTSFISFTPKLFAPASDTPRLDLGPANDPGTLTGTIRGLAGGALSGVGVTVEGTTVVTLGDGTYTIEGIPPEAYPVTFSRPGYIDKVVSTVVMSGPPTVLNATLAQPYAGAGTPVSGIISSSTTWTLAGSPYVLTGRVEVAEGTTLTIEPGAVVESTDDANLLFAFGTVSAVGAPRERVYFKDVGIVGVGASARLEFRHCVLTGGYLRPGGALILTDSRVEYPTQDIQLWYPRSDCYIERNIFKGSRGISTDALSGLPASVCIRNNVFFDQHPNSGSTYGFIMNRGNYAGSITYVNGNTFYAPTDAGAPEFVLALQFDASDAAMDGRGNYWEGMPDPSAYIYDKLHMSTCASVIPFAPTLVAPAAETPVFHQIEPVFSLTGVVDLGTYAASVTPNISSPDSDLELVSATMDGRAWQLGEQIGEGAHTLAVSVTDGSGNSARKEIDFTVDLTRPSVTSDAEALYAALQTLRISATDVGSGVDSVTYRLDSETTVTVYASATDVPIREDGAHTLSYYSTDVAGNTSETETKAFVVDLFSPVVSCDPEATYADAAAVSVSAVDTDSGVASLSYRLDQETTVTVPGALVIVETGAVGSRTLRVWATDVAGNVGVPIVRTFAVVDRTDPVVSCDPDATYIDEAAIPVSATDAGSGVASLSYRFDQETTVTVPGTSVVAKTVAAGSRTLRVWATDGAGNMSTTIVRSFEVVDRTGPVVSCAPSATYVNAASISVTAIDAGSGVDSLSYSLDGETTVTVPGASAWVATSTIGPHTLRIWATDNDGNECAPIVRGFSVVQSTGATTPGVSPSKPTHGKTATFTAWITPGGAAVTGTTYLYLYRYETKTVHKRVRGRTRHVKVKYWRLRSTLVMTPDAAGRVSVRTKLRYSGKWRAQVVFSGSSTCVPSSSGMRSFSAR